MTNQDKSLQPSGQIDFWFEFASPYSYLSARRINAMKPGSEFNVRWRPFLLGPIFKKQGHDTSPFNIWAEKGHYMWQDVARTAKKYGWPMRKPTIFPVRSLEAVRVSQVLEENAELHAQFCFETIRSHFEEDADISESKLLVSLLDACGCDDPEEVLERSRSLENKALAKERVDEAWRLGVFGAPMFIVGKERYWGNDRLDEAINLLRSTA